MQKILVSVIILIYEVFMFAFGGQKEEKVKASHIGIDVNFEKSTGMYMYLIYLQFLSLT